MRKNRKRSDLLQLIDRDVFDSLVSKWGVDKWARELKTWEFTCALVTVMTTRLGSYREVEQTLGVPRTTFGDAMSKRSYGFFEDLCDSLLLQIRGRTKDRKTKRAIREILAIDSTEVRVHGSLFSTPGWKQKICDGPLAAAKLHVIWNADGEWIDDFIITGVRRNDSPVSLQFELAPNKIYVFDRAYNDLTFWLKIIAAGSHFVTRLKDRSIAMLKDGHRKALKNSDRDGVLYDGVYEPNLGTLVSSGIPAERRLAIKFRYIVYRDSETRKVFYFVTSDFESTAQSIADVYKRRWAVELLFRWLKGHLNIRYLEPRNTNAIKVQLSAAVLTQLLLQLKKIIDHYTGSLWDLLRKIRTSLISQSLYASDVPDGCRWRSSAEKNLASGFA